MKTAKHSEAGICEIFDIDCANPVRLDRFIEEPDFDVPDPVKQGGGRWIDKGYNTTFQQGKFPICWNEFKPNSTAKNTKRTKAIGIISPQ